MDTETAPGGANNPHRRRRTAHALLLFTLLGCSEEGRLVPSPADATPDEAPDLALDAAPPADAEPDAWLPPSGPWTLYPANPFRPFIDAASGYQVVALLPDQRTVLGASGTDLRIFGREGGALARLTLTATIQDLALDRSGRKAAVASGDLQLIDLTDPSHPRVTGHFRPPEGVGAVALSPAGDKALVATRSRLDLIDPAAPEAALTSAELPGINQLVVAPDGNTALAIDGADLISLDLRGALTELDRLATSGGARAVALSPDGATAVVSHWNGLMVVDARNPADLVVRTQLEFPTFSGAVAVAPDGKAAYLAVEGAVQVIDLQGEALQVLATFEVGEVVFDLVPLGPHQVLVATAAGLLNLDLRNPPQPLAHALGYPQIDCRNLWDVQLSPDGRTAYTAGPELGIFALREPGDLVPLSQTGHQPRLSNLALSADGERLFAAGHAALEVLDVRDPAAPRRLATYDDPSATPRDIAPATDGRTLFLATEGGGGLDIVDPGPPGTPTRLSHLYIRHTESIVLSADQRTVFIADPYENGLVTIDVTNAQEPEALGRLPVQVQELALSPEGTRLAATGDLGLLLIDVTDPAQPVLEGTLELTAQGGDVAFLPGGQAVAVADGGGGLRIVDISDPTAPTLRATFDTPGAPTDLAVTPDGRRVVVLSGGATCMALLDLGPLPTLEPAPAPAPDVRRYTLQWTDRSPDHHEQIAWHVTGGHITLSAYDGAAHTATLDWTLPAEGFDDLDLTVAVGNHHYHEVVHASGNEER